MSRRLSSLLIALTVLAAACTAPERSGPSSSQGERAGPLKRVTAVVEGEHPMLISKLDKALPGAEAIEVAVASGFAIMSDQGTLTPLLVEAVPTTENGLWKINPDGTMQTTWQLKKNIVWHDGVAFTADDVLFTARVGQDRDMPNFRHEGYELVQSVQAPDAHTVTVTWKRSYIAADTLFSNDVNGASILFPLPKHLLEQAFAQDKARFIELPYWTAGFVGTGPFRLKEWHPGSHMVLSANDRFVAGRPKIDELVVRFIPDLRTMVANVLAGEADMTLGRGLSFQQGTDFANRWQNGRLENVSFKSRFTIYPQFIDPDPAIILDVNFRRALMHAMDRDAMAETLQLGMVPAAHAYIGPDNAMYKAIEPQIMKYEYDPRRASQMIESLGYTRGPDARFRDASGAPLSVELRATPGDLYDEIILTVADYWQRTGVGAETLLIPRQRQRDREWRATRPGFEMTRRGTNLSNLDSFYSHRTELPETDWVGSNISRYRNPELDGLIERFFTTVPLMERTRAVGQVINHITTNLPMMDLMYDGEPSLIANRLVNVRARANESTQTWNLHLWDVR